MEITRSLGSILARAAETSPVVTLTGPRQSGKTYLVQKTFPGYTYVSLEELDNREFAQSDPRGFLSTYPGRAIIDEIQKAPNLISYLQTYVDSVNRPGMYILTGSHNILLLRHISQTMAGRSLIFTLLPLSATELAKAGLQKHTLEETILWGGYPRLYTQQLEVASWFQSYIQTYVERDVRDISAIGNLAAFQKFVKLAAGRLGQLLNVSDLARDAGISTNTAKSWLSVLEAGYVIYILRPHYKNFGKRLIKSPKLYFIDTGLACWLLGIRSAADVAIHFARGALFENWVIMESVKHGLGNSQLPQLYFWRDKMGHEIDLIIPEKQTAVEVKASQTIMPELFSTLSYYKNLSKTPVKKVLVYAGDNNQKRSDGEVISWKKLPLFLKRTLG